MNVAWARLTDTTWGRARVRYDEEAKSLEHEFKEHYPGSRLQWRVLLAEEITDNPGDFFNFYEDVHIVQCSLLALGWKGQERLARSIIDKVQPDWVTGSVAHSMMYLLWNYLCGKEER